MDGHAEEDFSCDRATRSGSAVESTVGSAEGRAFGAWLRGLRERAGLTQAQLAARLGEDQKTVSNIETGQRRVDVIELRQILEALDGPNGAALASYGTLMAVLRTLGGQR